MTDILICSRQGDVHAEAVAWGLEALGRPATVWRSGDFPAEQSLSIQFDNTGPARHRIVGGGESLDLASVRTVWNRRVQPPRLSPDLHADDVRFAQDQCGQHLEGFLTTACPDALWVNRPAAARQDLNKPLQLRWARTAGLRIPPTLLSNSPDDIEAFFEANGGDVVFKPYKGGVWADDTGKAGVRVNFTTSVSRDDLKNRQALSYCPGIFQARIDKAFEVRVTAMGQSLFAVRIDPADDRAGALDWRATGRTLKLSVVDLPVDVADKLRALMVDAGLVFGCFDLIVTPGGDYCFIEVNQAGQFLWQEEHLPDLPLLDAMCRFLASSDAAFRYVAPVAALRFEDFRPAA